MTLSLRQKLTLATLAFYWVALIYLTHIPIPALVYQAHVSDKWLHFLAYLILVFLLWFSVSPDAKVNLRRPRAVWIVLVLALYGAMDEVTQGYVGRTCDLTDFLANLVGIFAGLAVFAFLDFWPAMLAVTAVEIFGLTNLARADISELLPAMNVVFHLTVYAFFTLLWNRMLSTSFQVRAPTARWAVFALMVPTVFLGIVKLSSVILGRSCHPADIAISLGGIVAVAAVIWMAASLRSMRRGATQS